MDLMQILDRVEKEFFHRIEAKTGWRKLEIKREFNEAVKNVLVTTYSAVMKDAKDAGIKTGDS